jgi:hypothetical protein
MGSAPPAAKVSFVMFAACNSPGSCIMLKSGFAGTRSKMDMAVANEDYNLAAQSRDQYNVSSWLLLQSPATDCATQLLAGQASGPVQVMRMPRLWLRLSN